MGGASEAWGIGAWARAGATEADSAGTTATTSMKKTTAAAAVGGAGGEEAGGRKGAPPAIATRFHIPGIRTSHVL